MIDSRALSIVGSERRAEVLVEALNESESVEAKRDLLRDWFNCCEAIFPQRLELREHFEHVEWVSDTDECPDFPVTVYRAAWEDDAIDESLSWTTDKAVAEKFARALLSPRAMFLGIWREDVEPWIWEATCESAFAYFQSRDEHEVVPDVLSDIRPIAVLQVVGERQSDLNEALKHARELR